MILEPGHRQWIENWKRYYQENMQRNIYRENKLEIFFMYFTILIKGGTFHLYKLKSPSPNDALCHVWSKLARWF